MSTPRANVSRRDHGATPSARPRVHSASGGRLGAADPREDGPKDLRLIPPALAAWAASAAALCLPGPWAAGIAVGCGLLAGCLLAAMRSGSTVRARPARSARTRALLGVAALSLSCAGASGGVAALHAADVHRGPLPVLAERHGRTATVDVTVTGDPRRMRPRVRGAQRVSGGVLFRAEATRVDTGPPGRVRASGRSSGVPASTAPPSQQADASGGGEAVRTPVLVLVRPGGRRTTAAWLRQLPTTGLRLEAELSAPTRGGPGRDIAAVLRVSAHGPPRMVHGPTVAQRAAGKLRAGLREATAGLHADARGLLPGLVVGDTSRLSPELEAAFGSTDMKHLLAVSGANLTILLAVFIGPPGTAQRAERRGLAARLGIPLRGTAVWGAVLTVGFVTVCRPDPSVLRAAACGLVVIAALATGRRRSLLPALATAVLALLLYDPWLALDFGFLLSVLATGALLTLAPGWSAALRRRGVPARLSEALAAAAAAQTVCAPVVAVLAAHVSLVAVPCNLLAEFAVAPATVLGFAALAAAPVAMPFAHALAWLASWPTRCVAVIARTGAGLPGAEIGWPGGWTGALALAAATFVVVLAVSRLRLLRGPWMCGLCALALLLALLRPVPLVRPFTGWPPPNWRMVACDVGQGDALVLATGRQHTAVVVDTGPEPDPVDHCLRSLGVTTVPLVVLTHFHADHVGGLAGVLRHRSVGAVQTTTLQEPAGQVSLVRRTAAREGVRLIGFTPGEHRKAGALEWRVLWPPASPDPSAPAIPPTDGPNDASITLLVRTAGLRLFLPGDLEPDAQRLLLDAHPELPAVDVLKVAHHGSAHQAPELLERLHPRIALISAGADNPYGHPAPRTVAAVRSAGALVSRTDLNGALAVTGSAGGAAERAGHEGPALVTERGNPEADPSGPSRPKPVGEAAGPPRSRDGRRPRTGAGGRGDRGQRTGCATRVPAIRRTRRRGRPAARHPRPEPTTPLPRRSPRAPPGRPATGRPPHRPHRPAPPAPPAGPGRSRRSGRRVPRPRPPPRRGPAAPGCVVARQSRSHCPSRPRPGSAGGRVVGAAWDAGHDGRYT